MKRGRVVLVLASVCVLLMLPATSGSTLQPESSTWVDAVELPARFTAGRIFVEPVTTDGDTLVFYTDTGGGANMLHASVADRLELPREPLALGEDTVLVTPFPVLDDESTIPPPSLLPPFGQRLLIPAEPPGAYGGSGLLGRTWFAGRVWSFDYPRRVLGLVMAYDADAVSPGHRVDLGFQVNAEGRRTTSFPRIRVEIAGDSIDMLFDTGAMMKLSPEARSHIGDDGPAVRGTSFIVDSIYRAWRTRHPDWRYIEQGDEMGDADLIEVPELSVAGYVVGPVWFAVRPDENFGAYMSQWMDRPVAGALGGSALQYFHVVVDYPNAVATFVLEASD